MDAVEEATDELYRIAPDDFVAERDARVAAAKENGDKETAKAIGALRRPSRSAWLTNLLVHDRPDEVEGLLGLGETLASAQRTLDGPALRQVSQQRNKLVAALSRRAAQLGRENGHRVDSTLEREVRGVLEAALADPELADRVRSGRLVKAERHAGFGPEPDGDARPRRDQGTSDGRSGTGGHGRGEDGDDSDGGTDRGGNGQGGTGQSGAGRGSNGRGGTGRSSTWQDGIGQNGAGRGGAGQSDEDAEDAAAREAERRERERREREIAKAEEALEKAEHTARERREEHERLADESVGATERQEKARDRVAELIDELDRARDESAAANKAAHAAAHAERDAARAARTAETARDRAAAALAELRE